MYKLIRTPILIKKIKKNIDSKCNNHAHIKKEKNMKKALITSVNSRRLSFFSP
jgi:ABC-type enterochelin transport system substrate-binding protein